MGKSTISITCAEHLQVTNMVSWLAQPYGIGMNAVSWKYVEVMQIMILIMN